MTVEQHQEIDRRIEARWNASLLDAWDRKSIRRMYDDVVATAHAEGLINDAEREAFQITKIEERDGGWDVIHGFVTDPGPERSV